MKTWRIAGINFDHLHMGDNLRRVFEHPRAEIAAICDEHVERMVVAQEALSIPADRVFTDYRVCLEETQPDIVILCASTGTHGDWVERIAPFNVHVVVEKPFAASLDEADRMVKAMEGTGKQLVIHWPMAWSPIHMTAKRLIDEGYIGDLLEVHFYDGNRGPLWHLADKVEVDAETVARRKPESWFYKRSQGGGSLLDYVGYGTVFGTWYQGGRLPTEVTTMVDEPEGLEVDEHSITIARYPHGLSKFETRWGTFTDPWIHQPQPLCGFSLVGKDGTIGCYDCAETLRVQTRDCPEGKDIEPDALEEPHQNIIQHLIHGLETVEPLLEPLTPAFSRLGQRIMDTALLSAREKRTVPLID